MSFLLVYLLRGRVEWHYTTFGRVVLLMRLIDSPAGSQQLCLLN